MGLFSDWPKDLTQTMIIFLIFALIITVGVVAYLNGWEKDAVAWLFNLPTLTGANG